MPIWPSIIRLVDSVEGAIGVALNCAVIYLLWHRKYNSNLVGYRICTTVTAAQGLLAAGLVALISNTAHIIHYDFNLFIVYGFLATFNESIGRCLVAVSLVSAFLNYQMIPGSCLIQYLTLCKPHLSTARRFIFAYGLCTAMMLWTIPYFFMFHSSSVFDEAVREVHETEPCDHFVTLGAYLADTENHPTGLIRGAIECVIPTFAISYFIFGFCVKRSQDALSSLNFKLSEKTVSMHRKFLVMLLLQGLLPLAVLSFPLALFIIGLSSGNSLGKLTLAFSFTYWTLPIIQGSVALMFVLRLKTNVVVERSRVSTTDTRF